MKFITPVFALLVTLYATTASAGTIIVRDSANFVPASDVSKLQLDATQWPFDVHVLAEVAPDHNTLEDDAHNSVDNPNVLVIAVDPTHHKTIVRFGNATGVKPGDYDSISQAGNAHFRSHEIAQGIEAIVIRSVASKQATVAISVSNAPVVVQQGLSAPTWFLIALFAGSLAGIVIWLVRKSRKDRESFEKALDDNRLETSELMSRNVEAMTSDSQWGAVAGATPAVPTPAVRPPSTYSARAPRTYARPAVAPVYTQPVVIQQNNSNDFLTGMLVGEMLEDKRDVVVEREVVRERREETSYDSGGSSSSSDSGSSSWGSSSSDDSGGSSSSWDSGSSSDSSSSSDSGGGGFDSGGGSSSW